MKLKLPAIGAAVAVIVGLLVWHNNGRETLHGADVAAAPFEKMRACIDTVSGLAPAIHNETLTHLVNGGFHAVSLDSLHRILGDDQLVAAITHTVIDTVTYPVSTKGPVVTHHDTVISIYYGNPPQADILEHEIGNAFGIRHRELLTGTDTGKLQTSRYYIRCVRYCPRCGAY